MNLKKRCLRTIIVLLLVTCSSLAASPGPADDNFPMYPSIKPNVEFWIDIFSKYSRSHGVIHDSEKLWIIYDVVSLDPSETIRSIEKNRNIRKAAVEKYKDILLRLSSKKSPRSKEESRVAALFGPGASPSDFKAAASKVRCQTGISDEFKKGLIRSGAVIDEFKKIFTSHGLPVDLVYLPCVESSYNFKAYSRFGAAGVWQFMYTTGKMYMTIDYVVDERRDPYISTDAAARLLKKNYAALGGWPLAITAYNHGTNGMLRAKNAAGSYENIFKTYTSSSFKFASRNFYPEFLAARIVAKNYETYFGKLEFHKPPAFQTIKTKGYLSVKDLADTLNVSISDIQTLNPSLRRPVFNEQKYIPDGFNLKLPRTVSVRDINTRLAGIYKNSQQPSRFHEVRKGDTASSIARLHSVRLDDLIHANHLNKKAVIYIGQNLRIPVKGEMITKTAQPVQGKKTVEIKTAAVSVQIPQPVPLTELSFDPVAEPIQDDTVINPYIVTGDLKILRTETKDALLIGIIRIEAEETLGQYADWLKVPIREIRSLNGLRPESLVSIDQEVKIPLRNITAQEFEAFRYEFHKEIEEDFFGSFFIQDVKTYEIKAGDNIWRLCQNEFEAPFWLVKKHNPNIDFNRLQLKQKIKYPIIVKIENQGQNG